MEAECVSSPSVMERVSSQQTFQSMAAGAGSVVDCTNEMITDALFCSTSDSSFLIVTVYIILLLISFSLRTIINMAHL